MRPALSTADTLLLLVLVILMQAHLLAACTGSLVSLLFAVQHGIGAVALLAHRPARQASSQARDMASGWTGTLLPLAMRATAEPAGWLSLAILASGSLLASGGILSLGRSLGMAPAIVGCTPAGSTGSCVTRSTPPISSSPAGFLTAHPSWWNGIAALVWLGMQIARIQREEALLRQDAQYQRHAQQARRRVLPGVW